MAGVRVLATIEAARVPRHIQRAAVVILEDFGFTWDDVATVARVLTDSSGAHDEWLVAIHSDSLCVGDLVDVSESAWVSAAAVHTSAVGQFTLQIVDTARRYPD
jgi:hypothetical protein